MYKPCVAKKVFKTFLHTMSASLFGNQQNSSSFKKSPLGVVILALLGSHVEGLVFDGVKWQTTG